MIKGQRPRMRKLDFVVEGYYAVRLAVSSGKRRLFI